MNQCRRSDRDGLTRRVENAGSASPITSAWRYDSLTTTAAGRPAKSIGKRVRVTGGDNTRRDYQYDRGPGDGILRENAQTPARPKPWRRMFFGRRAGRRVREGMYIGYTTDRTRRSGDA